MSLKNIIKRLKTTSQHGDIMVMAPDGPAGPLMTSAAAHRYRAGAPVHPGGVGRLAEGLPSSEVTSPGDG